MFLENSFKKVILPVYSLLPGTKQRHQQVSVTYIALSTLYWYSQIHLPWCTYHFADKVKLFAVQISKLDASKLSQETIIKDLKANISSLQSKLNTLEKEHDNLEKRHSSHTIQADSELKRLQQVSEEQVKILTEVPGSWE